MNTPVTLMMDPASFVILLSLIAVVLIVIAVVVTLLVVRHRRNRSQSQAVQKEDEWLDGEKNTGWDTGRKPPPGTDDPKP